MPSQYIPEGYVGPFTDEMVREYLKAKGIVPSPPGKTPTGKEYMAIMDLGLMKSPMFAPKPDEYYMDKWWNTTRSDGSARPMFPQASPVAPAAPAMPPAPVASVAPPAQPPAQQPRPLPPPEGPDEKALRINMEREAVRDSLQGPIVPSPMDKYADMTVPQNKREWADLERRYTEEKGVEHQAEMERLADKDTADLEFKKAKALIDDWKKRMRKESVTWTGKPQGANWPGMSPVLITRMPGQQVPAAALSPSEVRAMGGLQDDRDDQAELDKAWDIVQKRPGFFEKVDRSYMAGKLSGVSAMSHSLGTVADIVGADGVKKWTDERSADLMGAAEEKAEGGLGGIAGDVLQGYASIRGMGPMFKALGKAGLPVYEGLLAWSESNPDTEVEVPGFGKVKGQALPTLFGAVRGLLLHNILQTSSKTFGQVGARVASGAAFTAPDIIAKILTGNGLDVREIAANASMGAILGGPQRKGKPAKGVSRIGYGGEVKEEEPIPDRIRQEYSLGGMEPEPALAGNAVPDPMALPGRPTPQEATIKPKPELDAAFLGTNAPSRGPRKDTGPSMWSGPDPEEGPIMRMGYGGQQKDKTDFVVDPKTGLPKDPVKRTADRLLREKSGSMTKEVADNLLKKTVTGRMKYIFDKPSKDLTAGDITEDIMAKVDAYKQTPQYTARWDSIYERAKQKDRVLKPAEIAELKLGKDKNTKALTGKGKLDSILVVKLTTGCQRSNYIESGIEFGFLPQDVTKGSCMNSCWANRKAGSSRNERVEDFIRIEDLDMRATTPENIDKWWKNPKNVQMAKDTPLIRHGQMGDDSHSIATGAMLRWFEQQRAAGVTTKNSLITASYAPVTDEMYKALRPYRDLFNIQFSVSGWEGFDKAEIVNRLREFERARAAGLAVGIRVITNDSGVKQGLNKTIRSTQDPLAFPNHDFVMDLIEGRMGIDSPDLKSVFILETPYHNDFITENSKDEVWRSSRMLKEASECCNQLTGGQCKTCMVKCLTQFLPGGKKDAFLYVPEGAKEPTAEESKGLDIIRDEKSAMLRMGYGDWTNEEQEAGAATKKEGRRESDKVLRADEILRKQAAKGAEPTAVPKPTGINIGTVQKDQVIGYGTTNHTELKKSGVEYLGEMGPGEKSVEAYDQSVAAIKAYEGKPAGDLEVPDPAMLQDRPDLPPRPTHLQEIMPVRQIMDAVVKVKDISQDETETGLRFFERAGGGLVNVIKDVFFEPIQRGGSDINRAIGDLAVELKTKMASEGIKNTRTNTEKIGAFMTARQKGGTRTLELSEYAHAKDAEGKAVIELTPGEKRVVDWLDERFLQAFHEINNSRIASGQKPINWSEDYYTFWHIADIINRQGKSLITLPIKEVEAEFKRLNEVRENELSQREVAARKKTRFSKFMFTKRTGKLGPIDLDAFGVFTRYMHSAYEQIYLAEAQSIMKKIVDGRWKIDGKEWTMETGFENEPETAKPELKKSLSNYMGFLASGYQGDISPRLYEAWSTLSRNAAISKIGLNTKSVFNQLTSNLHSMLQLGPKVWTEGLADYIAAKAEGGERAKEGKLVGNLSNRAREIALEEFLKKRPRTAFGRGYQRVGELSMKPLQYMDMVTAEITWRGAYKSAYRGDLISRGVKRGDVRAAASYANAEVTRTQGSTQRWDLTPLQRRQWGRCVTTLQNFVINEWGFVTRDVFGYKNAERGPENIKKVVGLMVGTFLIDWLYEQAGMTGPMNMMGNIYQPIKAGVKASKEKGADVGSVALASGRALLNQVPIIGRGFGSVYGDKGASSILASAGNVLGVAADTLFKAPSAFLGKNRKVSGMIESAGGLFGIPGALPFKRAADAIEKGGTWQQTLGSFALGQKVEKKKKGSSTSGRSLPPDLRLGGKGRTLPPDLEGAGTTGRRLPDSLK